MRPALPHALGELAQTFARLSFPVKAMVTTGTALVVGFLLGSAAIGPILSANSPDNEEALQGRFERRTVDPQAHYPDPHPYRAQSPDFGPHRGPALGAHARQQAQRELRERGGRPALSKEGREAFGAAPSHETSAAARSPETTGSARPYQDYRPSDRHTGALH